MEGREGAAWGAGRAREELRMTTSPGPVSGRRAMAKRSARTAVAVWPPRATVSTLARGDERRDLRLLTTGVCEEVAREPAATSECRSPRTVVDVSAEVWDGELWESLEAPSELVVREGDPDAEGATVVPLVGVERVCASDEPRTSEDFG